MDRVSNGYFSSLDHSYQTMIDKKCVLYLISETNGDLRGLLEKLFFHTRKELGERMTAIWFFLLEIDISKLVFLSLGWTSV
jgi:hypothetical protein